MRATARLDSTPTLVAWKRRSTMQPARRGNILVLLAIMLPAMLATIGLVIDGGMLTAKRRDLQQVSDSAATAAAMELYLSGNNEATRQAATDYVRTLNGMSDVEVIVRTPPTTGDYIGNSAFVEVLLSRPSKTYVSHLLGGDSAPRLFSRSVAGRKAATAGAGIVVLDENPAPLAIDLGAPLLNMLPVSLTDLLPPLPTLLGGLECLGLGRARVDGAVLVNTRWGGVDEDNQPSGLLSPLQHGVSCTPIISLSKLMARDLRVAGGVDSLNNYANFVSGNPNPVKANTLPVPDPFASLPVPAVSVDSTNVRGDKLGNKSILDTATLQNLVKLLGLQAVLNLLGISQPYQPGVYDSIHVASLLFPVKFAPGVYVIRSRGPASLPPLILAGNVQAEGVMFYITDNPDFTTTGSTADASDANHPAPSPQATSLLPSAVIVNLLGSRFSPLNDPSSPYHGMTIFQRRHDRRPIILAMAGLPLLGGGSFKGTVYAKWGHVILAGLGTYDIRFVTGTMRILAVLDLTLAPSNRLPPAEDIFLVE